MSVRATYALDPETVQTLERLARGWNVSKSEALRRAVRAAGARRRAPTDALHTLDALQRSLKLHAPAAARWARETRAERHRTSARREPRR